MEQLAFLGFFQGPLGLGLSLALSANRIGRADLVKKVLLITFVATTIQWLVVAIGLGGPSAIVVHLACAILAKVLHDRWLFIPYRNQGSNNFTRGELVVFFLGVLAIGFTYGSLWALLFKVFV
ncbi:MAG: hypothetical protein ACI8QC_002088 [Planctomycetota bacterium]|jgi:hypothetical protein